MSIDALILLFASYLLGGIPSGLLLGSLRGTDVRQLGSGNIGATNVARTNGIALGVLTLLLDAGKGALAVGLAQLAAPAGDAAVLPALAAVGVVVGHCFPALLKFRGGKGVATVFGAMLLLAPAALLLPLLLFATIAGLSKLISLAAIVAALTLPAGAVLAAEPRAIVAASVLLAAIVIGRHHENIGRLLAGREKPLEIRRDEALPSK